MDRVFDSLALLTDPVRARLLRLIEQQELSVGEIAAVLQLPQSTTSRHLKGLCDGGWLGARRDGTSRLYRLQLEVLAPKQRQLWQLLRDSTPSWESDAERLGKILAQRQQDSHAFFTQGADRWDRVRDELFGRHLDRDVLAALLDPELTVADLGCGTGRLARGIAPFVGRVIAVDASQAMISAAKERLGELPNVELQQGQLEHLPIASGSVDLVLMVLVLHYVARPSVALEEARRVLRPGGRVLVVDMQPHGHEEYRQQMGHQWLGFDRAALTAWLAEVDLADAHYRCLAQEPTAKGPALFACSARLRRSHESSRAA